MASMKALVDKVIVVYECQQLKFLCNCIYEIEDSTDDLEVLDKLEVLRKQLLSYIRNSGTAQGYFRKQLGFDVISDKQMYYLRMALLQRLSEWAEDYDNGAVQINE